MYVNIYIYKASWFQEWLHARMECVVIQEFSSRWNPPEKGVPAEDQMHI